MLSMQFVRYFFIIHCAIFYHQFNIAKALVGPTVRSAEENEFPYIVSIMKVANFTRDRLQTFHKCTGTLVSKQDVLTAEHCLRSTFTEGFKVMVGSIHLDETTEFFPLFVLTYEHWTIYRRREIRYQFHDIAFIKLIGNVPPHIECATTGNIDNRLLYGLNLITAGWGRLENNTIPNTLQVGEVKVLSKLECEDRMYSYEGREVNIDPRRLCSVGNPYVVLNRGDSGGPLMYFGALIAINNGICPYFDGQIHRHQINLHMAIRWYQEFFEDVILTFHMEF